MASPNGHDGQPVRSLEDMLREYREVERTLEAQGDIPAGRSTNTATLAGTSSPTVRASTRERCTGSSWGDRCIIPPCHPPPHVKIERNPFKRQLQPDSTSCIDIF